MNAQIESERGTMKVDRRRKIRRGAEKLGAEKIEAKPTERRKVDRRKQVDPTTCERDYSEDEVDFMKAMDDYKRRSGRQFPTWSEVLEVLMALGYRRVAEPTAIDHAKRRDA